MNQKSLLVRLCVKYVFVRFEGANAIYEPRRRLLWYVIVPIIKIVRRLKRFNTDDKYIKDKFIDKDKPVS